MGVRHLETIMHNRVPGGVIEIDVEKEISRYKRKYEGKSPVIVIDIFSLQSLAGSTDHDIMLAGRHNIHNRNAENFFSRLKNMGAELIFFVDGPPQEDKIPTCLDRRNRSYDDAVEVLRAIDKGKDLTDKNLNLRLQNLLPFFVNLADIAKKYGEVHVATLNECDLELAYEATRIRALAVLSRDTDFLIYEGDWHYWSASKFDYEKFTTVEYDRIALKHYLNLSSKEIPLFATLSGNDIMKYEYVHNFHRRITRGKEANTHKKIAEIIQKNLRERRIIGSQDIRYFANLMFPPHEQSRKIDLIYRSLKSYNYKSIMRNHGDGVLNRVAKDLNRFNYTVLANREYIIAMYYFDLSSNEFMPFYDLIAPLIRRQVGILLQHLNDPFATRKFYYKRSHKNCYEEIYESPDYPYIRVPAIIELLYKPFGENPKLDQLRIELLCWCISPLLNTSTITQLPKESLLTSITILYLAERAQINLEEADCLLLANHPTSEIEKTIRYRDARRIDGRDARLAFLYTRLYHIIANCFHAVGLGELCGLLNFDGLYFHTLRKQWDKQSQESKDIELRDYEDLRLHAALFIYNRKKSAE